MNSDDMCNGERYIFNHWVRYKSKTTDSESSILIFDVGANIGSFSISVKEKLPACRLFSFEPQRVSFNRLRSGIEKFDNVVIENIGLSSEQGSAIIYDYERGDSPHATLSKDAFESIYAEKVKGSEIKVDTIDGYCESNKIEFIDYLKIDVEGHELDVVQGALKMLGAGNIEVIQFEFNSHHAITGTTLWKLSSFMPGYTICRIVSNGLIPVIGPNISYSSRQEIFRYSNFLGFKDIANWKSLI